MRGAELSRRSREVGPAVGAGSDGACGCGDLVVAAWTRHGDGNRGSGEASGDGNRGRRGRRGRRREGLYLFGAATTDACDDGSYDNEDNPSDNEIEHQRGGGGIILELGIRVGAAAA